MATMQKPLVSAIMPAFNAAEYLSESIEGVLNQSYSNWELIIVDDGSTDRTKEIVKGHKDPRIKYIAQKNRGRGAARNRALRVAKGRYIAITDADDISMPSRFSRQVEYLEQHHELGVVSCQPIHLVRGEKKRILITYPCSPEDVEKEYRRGVMGVSHAGAMIRMEVFERVGLYCEQCLRAQDFELFLRIVRYFNLASLPERLLVYRNDPTSTSYLFWLRLHAYHEYALYRNRSYVKGENPKDFIIWRKSIRPILKLLTWHSIRYVKARIYFKYKLLVS